MPRQTKMIPIGEINVPEVRITAVYDQDLQNDLSESIGASGQLVPIVVVKTDEGYELVDGLHRMEEAQRRGEGKVYGTVLEGDEVTALLHNMTTNRLRGKTKASEIVKVIEVLTRDHGLDSVAIQERTGMTRDYIERLWKISEAHPSVREALDTETIGVGVAFQLSRLPRHEQQLAVMNTATTYHMTTSQAKGLVDEVLQQMEAVKDSPPKVTPPAPPPPECEVCHRTPDPKLLISIPLCPICFGKIGILVEQQETARVIQFPPGDEGGDP